MNTKTQEIYSDKFILRVLNLNVLDDDAVFKEHDSLYEWARLFKATTWEEMKMLAKHNSYIADAVYTYHEMSEEEKVQQQCWARERYNKDMASAIAKGRSEGHAEGLTEGENRKLISQICRKLAKGKTLEDIAEDLEEDLVVAEKIYNIAKDFAPDYDEEQIYNALKGK